MSLFSCQETVQNCSNGLKVHVAFKDTVSALFRAGILYILVLTKLGPCIDTMDL